jgi:iron complex transport system substrate-binding protein
VIRAPGVAVLRPAVAGLVLSLLAASGSDGREVRDMLGRTVRIPDRLERLVSLAPSVTEIVYALGAEDRLAGVTDHCDFPPDARRKPKVGGFYAPNFEVILSLKPDLILATAIEGGREEAVRGLEGIRVPAYVVKASRFDEVLVSMERLGDLLGRAGEASRLTAAMRAEAQALARAVEPLRRPRVLYVLWGHPLIVPGRDTLITDLIRRAGGESVTAGEPLAYPRFAAEEAVVRRADLVVLARHGQASVDRRLDEWRHLRLLPAVREGRIHEIDGDLTHRPGPRIMEAIRLLARIFHPGLAASAGR